MVNVTRHQLYQIYRSGHARPALTSIWGIHGQGRDVQRRNQRGKNIGIDSGRGTTETRGAEVSNDDGGGDEESDGGGFQLGGLLGNED